MHKRKLHHLLTRLRSVKYAYLIVALLISSTIFIVSYRQNNLRALELRDVLLQVDKDNGDVEVALRELREFTYAHMNANLSAGSNGIYPPIQLKYRYERLVEAEKQRIEASNSQIYTEAQTYCEAQVPSRVTRDRVPCIQQYLADHTTETPRQVPDSLYKFDFLAPAWSPDIAGWSLLVSLVLLVLLVSRIILEFWLRAQLRA